ncbi:MAG: diaminopimelate epimerase [Christensenellaceae bacterium]|jgi:diaminopimelate epimerase
MELHFTKMHGCGNDYIYFNGFSETIENPAALSVSISPRHFAVGSDGVVLILPSTVADAKMRIFNADGSEAEMCGNAIRCVAKYLYENNMVKKEQMHIETLGGIKAISLAVVDGVMSSATVDMGAAIFSAQEIPVALDLEEVIDYPLVVEEKEYRITCVSVGNPHCVVFCENIDALELPKLGPLFENNPLFPERINTEFIQLMDSHTIKMRVWERGSGETNACGTGACAAVAAAVKNGYLKENEDITVQLLGGTLVIYAEENRMLMTGPATRVFEGVIVV